MGFVDSLLIIKKMTNHLKQGFSRSLQLSKRKRGVERLFVYAFLLAQCILQANSEPSTLAYENEFYIPRADTISSYGKYTFNYEIDEFGYCQS